MPIFWLITTFVAAAIFCATPPMARVFARVARSIDSPIHGICLVLLVALGVGAIPSVLNVVPPPSTHDEFAYLLAADTFAHGRLTNPTPACWEHFETFHEIVQPSYMAKFPPGQGLALAAGQTLGLPIAGAFVTVALACGAVTWMLCAWMPPRWACVGGLLAALQPTIFFWGQSYWGGGVAMLGGALVCGAFARAIRRPTGLHGLLAGAGAAILANSRPFEGALLCGILLVLLAAMNWGSFVRLVLPAGVVLAPVFGWMLYYNWRITGDALVMPYAVHARQYMMSPLFWWQSAPSPPKYRHPKLQQYYQLHEFAEYDRRRAGLGGFIAGLGHDMRTIAREYLAPPTLALPLLALPPVLRRRRAVRLSCGVITVFLLLHFAITPWLRMQYLAPLAGLLFATIVLCCRQMSASRSGAAAVRAVLVVQAVSIVVTIVQMSINPAPPGSTRAREVERIRSLPGKHLVIVRHAADRQSLFEWVWNNADIETDKVILARELDDASNQRLIEHYAGRKLWLLSIDGLRYSLDPIQ
jgi:hypothetical protein